MTFANTFSASGYSKEWSRAVARLKSTLAFSEQEKLKSTVPNWPFPEPHKAMSPRFKSRDFNSVSNCTWFFLGTHENKHDQINAIRKPWVISIVMYFIK